jgi:hypothetical protein
MIGPRCKSLMRGVALAGVVTLGACDLAIENPTQGDTDRVLGTPADAEALISTYYKRWSSGVYGALGTIEGMATVMSLMNYASAANNCLNNHAPFANISNGNSPGNVCATEQSRLYQYMNEVARVSSNLLSQMNGPDGLPTGTDGLTLGSSAPATDARNLRARAWAEFLRGLSLGYIAMMHDSSSIVSPNMGTAPEDCVDAGGVCTGALRHYTVVADSSMAAFQRALDYTNAPVITGSDGFPIPDTWLPSIVTWTAPEFTRLIRSYRARIRANVVRSSAETVDWAAVVADAQNGITADHYVVTSTTTGPSYNWRNQFALFTTWHQMPPFIIGMADQSTSYENWINTPLVDRGAGNTSFFMQTADLRFPQGATRAQQQNDFVLSSCDVAATACKRYFVNRQSADQFSGAGWGWSNYDFVRFHSWRQRGDANSAQNGRTPIMSKSEMDLLQAEGLYKLSAANDAQVATLINVSRTRGMGTHPVFGTADVALGGGLPPVLPLRTAAATGATCIPKIPNAAGIVSCGDLWEALKYEKRIETAYVHYASWFLDSRRWDDLPKDTPLFWPVPYQDLQARGRAIDKLYGTGPGPGNAPNSTAPGSAYGW